MKQSLEQEKIEKTTVNVELEYGEGDIVEHSMSKEKGIIISWRIEMNMKSPMYLVSMNSEFRDWFSSHELVLHTKKSLIKRVAEAVGFRKNTL